jgi:homoprotocatechuate degradation regulator HpaR
MRPFSASLPMALLRAREAAMRRFRPVLADHHLTEQQWRVLRALTASDEPMEVTALADATFLLAPSLSRILANLESRRLVRRATHPSDQRRSMISLSDDGRAVVSTIAPESEATYEAIEQRFGAERLAHLLGELAELARLDDAVTATTDSGRLS